MEKRKAIKRNVESESVYRIIGVTKDGVKILKSPGRATHFTDKEISDAVRTVLTAQERRNLRTAAIAKRRPLKKV